ncbi:MAG: AMP-binding protein, partial [Methylococcales bacterium]|nr:AMP-binding protein [Methylococcales bacterium]
PFETLVERLKVARHRSISPLFQVMFSYFQDDNTVDALGFELAEFTKQPKFDLTISVLDQPNQTVVELEYRDNLYSKQQINTLITGFSALLDNLSVELSDPVSQLYRPVSNTSPLPELNLVTVLESACQWHAGSILCVDEGQLPYIDSVVESAKRAGADIVHTISEGVTHWLTDVPTAMSLATLPSTLTSFLSIKGLTASNRLAHYQTIELLLKDDELVGVVSNGVCTSPIVDQYGSVSCAEVYGYVQGSSVLAFNTEPALIFCAERNDHIDWLTFHSLLQTHFGLSGINTLHYFEGQLLVWLDDGVDPNLTDDIGKILKSHAIKITISLKSRHAQAVAQSALAGATLEVIEQTIIDVWQTILILDEIDRDDDFFELGGHSLLAVQCAAQLQERLATTVSVKALFDFTTVSELATYLANEGDESEVKQSELVQVSGQSQLTPAQSRLWFLQQLEPESAAYNVPSAIILKGQIDLEKLTAALALVVSRHAIFNTTFTQTDNGIFQTQSESHLVDIQWLKGSGDSVNLGIMDAEKALLEAAKQPFDLSESVARVYGVEITAEEVVIGLVLHHIVTDAWSMQIILRELYQAYVDKAQLLPAPQYAEYVQWQQTQLGSAEHQDALHYWVTQLSNVPALQLPKSAGQQIVDGHKGAIVSVDIQVPQQTLKPFLQAQKMTAFQLYSAVFALLLHKISGQNDLTIGTPVTGRSQLSFQSMVGLFVNTVVLRSQLTNSDSISAYLQAMKHTCVSAMDHQTVPFEQLVEQLVDEREMTQSPLFQVLFTYQPEQAVAEQVTGLSVEPLSLFNETSKYALFLSLQPHGDQLNCHVEYNPTQHTETQVNTWLSAFEILLNQVLNKPNQAIESVTVIDANATCSLKQGWAFEAAATPFKACCDYVIPTDGIAINTAEMQLTYQALDELTTDFAKAWLPSLKTKQAVALYLERSAWWPIAMLAVMKTGRAYCPLNQSDPLQRHIDIIADASIQAIVCLEQDVSFAHSVNLPVLSLVGQLPQDIALPVIQQDDIAYILFTSGST